MALWAFCSCRVKSQSLTKYKSYTKYGKASGHLGHSVALGLKVHHSVSMKGMKYAITSVCHNFGMSQLWYVTASVCHNFSMS